MGVVGPIGAESAQIFYVREQGIPPEVYGLWTKQSPSDRFQ